MGFSCVNLFDLFLGFSSRCEHVKLKLNEMNYGIIMIMYLLIKLFCYTLHTPFLFRLFFESENCLSSAAGFLNLFLRVLSLLLLGTGY